jgi:hypothetical protein
MTTLLLTLAAIFAIGTWGFWIACIILGGAITLLVENEKGTWATFTAIATILGLNYISKIPIFEFVTQHPLRLAELIAPFLAGGVVTSIIKWYLYSLKAARLYDDYKEDFLKENNVKEFTGEWAFKLQEALKSGKSPKYDDWGNRIAIQAEPLSFKENKARLIRWATYWPFVIVGTVLNDFVRKIWIRLVESLRSTYQGISNHAFRRATADLKLAQDYRDQKEVERAAKMGASDTGDGPRRVRPNN